MVEQVTAWRDQSGRMHATRIEAMKADARIELESLFKNTGIANDILNNRQRVVDALVTLVHIEEAEKTQHEKDDKQQ